MLLLLLLLSAIMAVIAGTSLGRTTAAAATAAAVAPAVPRLFFALPWLLLRVSTTLLPLALMRVLLRLPVRCESLSLSHCCCCCAPLWPYMTPDLSRPLLLPYAAPFSAAFPSSSGSTGTCGMLAMLLACSSNDDGNTAACEPLPPPLLLPIVQLLSAVSFPHKLLAGSCCTAAASGCANSGFPAAQGTAASSVS
jgi:hypothetical protein